MSLVGCFVSWLKIFSGLIITGASTFMSKYLERQFSVAPSKANMLIGWLFGFGFLIPFFFSCWISKFFCSIPFFMTLWFLDEFFMISFFLNLNNCGWELCLPHLAFSVSIVHRKIRDKMAQWVVQFRTPMLRFYFLQE